MSDGELVMCNGRETCMTEASSRTGRYSRVHHLAASALSNMARSTPLSHLGIHSTPSFHPPGSEAFKMTARAMHALPQLRASLSSSAASEPAPAFPLLLGGSMHVSRQ